MGKKGRIVILLSFFLFSCCLVLPAAIPVIFLPRFMFKEPRFERPWLSTVECFAGKSWASSFYDASGMQHSFNAFFSKNSVYRTHYIQLNYLQSASHGLFLYGDTLLQKELLCKAGVLSVARGINAYNIFGFGWTKSSQESDVLDYVDCSLKVGGIVLSDYCFPKAFLPNSYLYDGKRERGAMFIFDCAVGIFDWFSAGIHFDATFFSYMPWIQFVSDCKDDHVTYLYCKNETVVGSGFFFKADHVIKGLSLTFAFVRTGTVFSDHWSHSTINWAVEYDFTEYQDTIGPRILLFYDKIVSGKNVCNTRMFSGGLGIEIVWRF